MMPHKKRYYSGFKMSELVSVGIFSVWARVLLRETQRDLHIEHVQLL